MTQSTSDNNTKQQVSEILKRVDNFIKTNKVDMAIREII
jgi:hypothetical protein